ncbi:hypothetical protein PR003_g11968 [Phytophthora rubi]|uniref:Secreted protein n=1 Tax=Phytophthora rubi TaxID=129364 RepID=A0A6A3M7P9_9STRA|nr:hypothetical protein PR002_g11481 [Phytophthora rubi]KAE9047753.1 hypothetical protein PR001_g4086 [Phytophthora rubi]KAE9337526.1 hypothetical protein PR003_g11968 [Phytophthora rubi]
MACVGGSISTVFLLRMMLSWSPRAMVSSRDRRCMVVFVGVAVKKTLNTGIPVHVHVWYFSTLQCRQRWLRSQACSKTMSLSHLQPRVVKLRKQSLSAVEPGSRPAVSAKWHVAATWPSVVICRLCLTLAEIPTWPRRCGCGEGGRCATQGNLRQPIRSHAMLQLTVSSAAPPGPDWRNEDQWWHQVGPSIQRRVGAADTGPSSCL